MGCRDILQPVKVTVVLKETRAAWTVNTMLLLPTVDITKGAPDTVIVLD